MLVILRKYSQQLLAELWKYIQNSLLNRRNLLLRMSLPSHTAVIAPSNYPLTFGILNLAGINAVREGVGREGDVSQIQNGSQEFQHG